MSKKQKLGPRAFLKGQGIKFGKSIRSLDLAFLRAFPDEKQEIVIDVWERVQMQLGTVQELYDLPETHEQISLLVSHDAPRMVASLGWFESVVASLDPKSVIEFGCGAGFLLSYLRHAFPEAELTGVDRQANLTRLIDKDDKLTVFEGDYREMEPGNLCDLVVCDFGWDNHDIPQSTKPHTTAEIAGYSYCPGCSDDEIPFFASMLGAWKGWAKPEAPLAVAGRLMDLTDLRAIVLAAEQHNWHLDAQRSTQLEARNLIGETENFPALIFTTTKQEPVLQTLEKFVLSHGW